MEGKTLPNVPFHLRVRDERIGGSNPYRWDELRTEEMMKDKRVVIFGLPGAFTPTCSDSQLPGFEAAYDDIIATGVDEVYCVSINDAFVMNKWAELQGVTKVKMLPDGNGWFTNELGMIVSKCNFGFGNRSWRYAIVVDTESEIEKAFIEAGKDSNIEEDPYVESTPENVLAYLTGR
jgi:peroxiredoxin